MVAGSLFSIYFTDKEVVNYRSLARIDKEMARGVFLALLQEGCLLSPGLWFNALSTPMDESHVDGLLAALERAIARAQKEVS